MNTVVYAKRLEEVGFSREQAEMTVGILNEVIESKLASKQDVKDLDTSFRHELRLLKSELIIKLGAMMVTGMAVISALIKLF